MAATDPGSPSTPRAALTAAHIAVLVLFGGLVTALNYKLGASLGSDSTRFAFAAQLLDGRIPYRSLLGSREPGSYAFDAAVLALRGRTMGAEHLAALLEGAVLYPVATYVFGRLVLRRAWLGFAAGLVLVLLFRPAPGVPLTCALVSTVLTARWLSTGSTRAIVGAGAAAGITIAFSTGLAAAAIGGVVATIVLRAATGARIPAGSARVPVVRPLAAFGTGATIGAVPFAAALVAEGGLATYARYLVQALTAFVRGAGAAFPAPSLATARLYLPMLCLPPALMLLARVARTDARGRALVGLLLVSTAGLRVAATAAGPDSARVVASLADLPLTAAWLADWALDVRGRIALPRADFALALGVGLAAAGGGRLALGRPSYALSIPLAAAVVGAASLGARFGEAPASRRIRVTALLLALTLIPVAAAMAPGRLAPDSTAGMTRLSGAWWPSGLADEITRAGGAVEGAVDATGSAFVYPRAGFLYEVFRRRNPTSFPVIDAGASRFEIRRVVAELTADQPGAVLVRYRGVGEGAKSLAPVTRFLEDRYVETRRFDSPELWGVWVRGDPPQTCRRLMLYAREHASNAGEGAAARVRVGRPAGAHVEPDLVQLAPVARFSVHVGGGSFVRFAVSTASQEPGAERSLEIEALGQRVEVWRGTADGIARRLVLPPLPSDRAELVLRSPAGRTTLWTEPTACTPR